MSRRRVLVEIASSRQIKKEIEQRLSYCRVARDLGIRDHLIRNGRKAFEADGTLASEVYHSPGMEAEIKRLRARGNAVRRQRLRLPLRPALEATRSRRSHRR